LYYESTRNNKLKKKFSEVLLLGLAEDGGLFIPKKWPKVSKKELSKFKNMNYQQIAFHISKKFIENEINDKDLKKIIRKSFKNFSKKSNIEKKILGNLFGQLIIEALVENLVTPENLILLVNDPDKYKNLIEDKIESPIKKINYIQKIGYKKNNLEIKYIFFINVNKFRLSFIKDDYPIIIDLRLNSFKWKLVRVHLPIDLLVSKINN